MKIKKKFLQLTRYTYPYGTEGMLEKFLPNGYQIDKYGNYYISIGENYTTMFTCHLDTSCKLHEKVNHKFDKNYIMTDGTTILGADDKAGMVVVLYMIENKVPGLYYFFIGEEVGCIGSSDVADDMEKSIYDLKQLKDIKKVVSFDRRGTTSVITDQFYGNCCSDEFAKELSTQLNNAGYGLKMAPDDTGILTDSAQFMGCVPECTNISVGYYDEHTSTERQDIAFLYNLCYSVVKVDWESLPIKRYPRKYNYGYAGWGDWDSIFDSSPSIRSIDPEYSRAYYTFVMKDNVRTMAYISKTWILHETLRIQDMLKKQGRNVDKIEWDGTSCWCLEKGERVNEYVGNRRDLSEMIPNFSQIPVAHLKYELPELPELDPFE